jgi:hypothetical protein
MTADRLEMGDSEVQVHVLFLRIGTDRRAIVTMTTQSG